jgi:hypothetical protein
MNKGHIAEAVRSVANVAARLGFAVGSVAVPTAAFDHTPAFADAPAVAPAPDFVGVCPLGSINVNPNPDDAVICHEEDEPIHLPTPPTPTAPANTAPANTAAPANTSGNTAPGNTSSGHSGSGSGTANTNANTTHNTQPAGPTWEETLAAFCEGQTGDQEFADKLLFAKAKENDTAIEKQEGSERLVDIARVCDIQFLGGDIDPVTGREISNFEYLMIAGDVTPNEAQKLGLLEPALAAKWLELHPAPVVTEPETTAALETVPETTAAIVEPESTAAAVATAAPEVSAAPTTEATVAPTTTAAATSTAAPDTTAAVETDPTIAASDTTSTIEKVVAAPADNSDRGDDGGSDIPVIPITITVLGGAVLLGAGAIVAARHRPRNPRGPASQPA